MKTKDENIETFSNKISSYFLSTISIGEVQDVDISCYRLKFRLYFEWGNASWIFRDAVLSNAMETILIEQK
jgi:hypothetical protein